MNEPIGQKPDLMFVFDSEEQPALAWITYIGDYGYTVPVNAITGEVIDTDADITEEEQPPVTETAVTQELPEGARMASVENIDEDSSLNLRAQPSTAAEILMRLYWHQQLIVLEEAEVTGWLHVKTDVIEGYVMMSFLEKAESESGGQ